MNSDVKTIRLMDDVRWKGTDNWSQRSSLEYEKEIPAFRQWLMESIESWVYPEYVAETLDRYFFKNESEKAGDKFWSYLNQGRSALATLYAYQRFIKQVTQEIAQMG